MQLWHRCSEMPYRLLTHTNRHLHKVSCSASVAFRDATVNCLSSVFNQSLCPYAPLLIPTAALWFSPLSTSLFHLSHLSSYPPDNIFWSIVQLISLLWYPSFCLLVIAMLINMPQKFITVKSEFPLLVFIKL